MVCTPKRYQFVAIFFFFFVAIYLFVLSNESRQPWNLSNQIIAYCGIIIMVPSLELNGNKAYPLEVMSQNHGLEHTERNGFCWCHLICWEWFVLIMSSNWHMFYTCDECALWSIYRQVGQAFNDQWWWR